MYKKKKKKKKERKKIQNHKKQNKMKNRNLSFECKGSILTIFTIIYDTKYIVSQYHVLTQQL